jgi:hypothetical protein
MSFMGISLLCMELSKHKNTRNAYGGKEKERTEKSSAMVKREKSPGWKNVFNFLGV